MVIEHRATCSKAENRASGLVDQAGLDEVKTTGREKAWASWEQGQTTRQMGQLDWLQLEAQSWLVFKSSTCLLFNYWTVSVRFQGCRNLLFLLLKQHCMMNTFSKKRSHCPFVSLCICYWVHMNNYKLILHDRTRAGLILSNFKNEMLTKTFKTVTRQGLGIQNHCCPKYVSYLMYYCISCFMYML